MGTTREIVKRISVCEPFWEPNEGKIGNYFGNPIKELQFGN